MNVHVSISQLSDQKKKGKKMHPVSFVILEVRIYGLAKLKHLKYSFIKLHTSQKANEPTHHVPKILISSLISFQVVLRYRWLERIA